jgi:hypothetical protein
VRREEDEVEVSCDRTIVHRKQRQIKTLPLITQMNADQKESSSNC